MLQGTTEACEEGTPDTPLIEGESFHFYREISMCLTENTENKLCLKVRVGIYDISREKEI